MTAPQKKALWRRFEAATPQEREAMVTWVEKGDTPGGEGTVLRIGEKEVFRPVDAGREVVLMGIHWLFEPTDPEREFPTEGEIVTFWAWADKTLTWRKCIIHNKTWIRIRNSFYPSKEWKQFHRQWIQDHPACARCGRTDGVLQVHHAGRYNLDRTVLDEGFLEALKHPERFETVCGDCHYAEHRDLIEAERRSLV